MTLLALATGAPLPAQTGDQGKPPVYRHIAEWDVPRAQWAEMVKVELLADGVVTSYGIVSRRCPRAVYDKVCSQ